MTNRNVAQAHISDNISYLANRKHGEVLVNNLSIGALAKDFTVIVTEARQTKAVLAVFMTAYHTVGSVTSSVIVKWDGTTIGNCKIFVNTTSYHQQLHPTIAALTVPIAANTIHTLRLENGANVSTDVNDYCTAILFGS